MVMPGRAFTSSSAWTARVPVPLGRPRRPVPEPLARRAAARGAGRRAARRGSARRCVPTPESALLGGLEAVVLVDQRSQLLQPRLDLLALLLEKVGHSANPFVKSTLTLSQITGTSLTGEVALPGPCSRNECTAFWCPGSRTDVRSARRCARRRRACRGRPGRARSPWWRRAPASGPAASRAAKRARLLEQVVRRQHAVNHTPVVQRLGGDTARRSSRTRAPAPCRRARPSAACRPSAG